MNMPITIMNADRNNVELCGRLVRDMRLCKKKDGAIYGIITVLSKRGRGEKGEFLEAFLWNEKLVDCYGRYLRAGRRVAVRGWLSRTRENFYINVTEDYGVMITMDIKDLKKGEENTREWVKDLEEENKAFEEKLKEYEEKYEEKGIKANEEVKLQS